MKPIVRIRLVRVRLPGYPAKEEAERTE